MKQIVGFLCIAMLVVLCAGGAHAQRMPVKRPAPAARQGAEIAVGGSFGLAMAVSSTPYLYNYNDYVPAGLGLRYGMTGEVRLKVTNVQKATPDFAFIADARYSNVFHSSDFAGSPGFSASAAFGMLSFGAGIEQAVNMGRALPYFGLTVDVNAIAPGSRTITTRDSAGGQHSVTKNLAGDIWQLRFGVTPRAGLLVRITRDVSFDASVDYQIINLLNRADQTPGNFLLDPFGREPVLSQMNVLLGVDWTLPARGR